MDRDQIYIIGGGTFAHVRPHLALAAPAFGTSAFDIANAIAGGTNFNGELHMYTTKMAGDLFDAVHVKGTGPFRVNHPVEFYEGDPRTFEEYSPNLVTNDDVLKLILEIVANPRAKILFMPVALTDFQGFVLGPPVRIEEHGLVNTTRERTPSGKSQPRLKSNEDHLLRLEPAPKVIRRVREERKDLFLVGFKTTTGATADEQFEAGLKLVKEASCNLVLANDLHTRLNMIITPEQARYANTMERGDAIDQLVEMALSRAEGHFTRTHVVGDDYVPWGSDNLPQSLKTVVEHCIKRGAYKPFMGKTVGHFAVKRDDKVFYTSPRGQDFNKLIDPHAGFGMIQCRVIEENPMVELSEHVKVDDLLCYGGKPSVGGMSQRIIFENHPEMDCIVHFHCPMREDIVNLVPVAEQWPHECGSHECGKNTSDNLHGFNAGNSIVKAVMLDKHGPNIVFNSNIDPQSVIDFIEKHFDLTRQTSELT